MNEISTLYWTRPKGLVLASFYVYVIFIALGRAATESDTDCLLSWSEQHVQDWVKNLGGGLAAYHQNFKQHLINGDALMQLDHSSLLRMGVSALGDRHELLERISHLQDTCVAKCSVQQWSTQQVQAWLQWEGFDKAVVGAFTQQKIKGSLLLMLNVDTIKGVLILPVGVQTKIAKSVEVLRLLCKGRDVEQWSAGSVGDFLETLGPDWSAYKASFFDNDISGKVLLTLEDSHLQQLGMTIGKRQELLARLRKLREQVDKMTALDLELLRGRRGFSPSERSLATKIYDQVAFVYHLFDIRWDAWNSSALHVLRTVFMLAIIIVPNTVALSLIENKLGSHGTNLARYIQLLTATPAAIALTTGGSSAAIWTSIMIHALTVNYGESLLACVCDNLRDAQRYFRLRADYNELESKKLQCEAKCFKLEADYRERDSAYSKLEADYRERKSAYSKLEADYRERESAYNKLKSKLLQLEEDYANLRAKNKKLESKLSQFY